jgi:hypothetical protein
VKNRVKIFMLVGLWAVLQFDVVNHIGAVVGRIDTARCATDR